MAAGQQAGQRLADLLVFPDDDLADLSGNGVEFGEHEFSKEDREGVKRASYSFLIVRKRV
jgi:hypothetical protein